MVIGPKDLVHILNQQEEDKLQRFEMFLDKKILSQYKGKDKTTIKVNKNQVPGTSSLDSLFQKYRDAGWKQVSYNAKNVTNAYNFNNHKSYSVTFTRK